jgi:hypothetical protein
VQGHLALDVPLGTAHLGTAQTTTTLDANSLGAVAHGRADGLLHGPAERDAARKLLRDPLGDELSIQLGLLDLDDVEAHVGRLPVDLGFHVLEVRAQALGLGTAAADHDARPGGMSVDTDALTRALDIDPADAGVRQLAEQVLADPQIGLEVVAVLLLGEPPRLPVGVYPKAESVWMNFLTH